MEADSCCSPEEPEARYRTLCSLETLRSGKKGFFRDFAENATRIVGEQWISKVFGRLTTDEDRVRRIFTDERAKDAVLETLNRTEMLYRGKDAAASRARRLEAFQAATAGELGKALLLSSQAVLRAPLPGRKEAVVDRGLGLPLALLARTEILLAANEPALALQDLTTVQALSDALPDALRTELARKKKEAEDRVASEGQLTQRKPSLPRLGGGPHPRLPGASALLEIEETATAGKRAVASTEIAPGDTLVVESPLAAALLPEFFGTHCHHCFARFRAPVGCPDCSSVAFCGRECRDAAVSSYHKHECKILALLIGSGMSVLSMLALRMVTQAGPTECSKIQRALNRRGSCPPRDDEIEPSSAKLGKSAKRRSRKKKLRDSMRVRDTEADRLEPENGDVDLRAYDLVAHEARRSAKDFFHRSLMAAFLLKCLQRVGFFESCARDAEPPTEEEIAVGALLLRHLQLLQFNAHEVFETRHGAEHRFRGSRPVYLGVAIYPVVARFNHECYPAVARYFVGRRIVIRATRNLSPGEAVAENYGPIFTKRTAIERRRTLAGRYWFRCECPACREDWPRFETLTNEHARLRCPSERCSKLHRRPRDPARLVECSSCRRKVDLKEPLDSLLECERLYARGFAAMEEEHPGKALEAFFEAARKFHRVAVPPHRDTHLAEIAAAACMAEEGNVWQADRVVPQTTKSRENRSSPPTRTDMMRESRSK